MAQKRVAGEFSLKSFAWQVAAGLIAMLVWAVGSRGCYMGSGSVKIEWQAQASGAGELPTAR